MINLNSKKAVIASLMVASSFQALAQTDHPNSKMSALPQTNPWLTESVYPTSHHNPAQTDVSPIAGPAFSMQLSKDQVKTIPAVFNSNPTTKHIGKDRIIMISGVNGVRKVLATGDQFEQVSFLPYPGLEGAEPNEIMEVVDRMDKARFAHDDKAILAESKNMADLGFTFKTVANGVYNLFDNEGYHYSMYSGVNIMKSTDNNDVNAPQQLVKTANITDGLPADLAKNVTRAVGFGMTYDGHLAVAAPGMVGLYSRDLDLKGYITFPGEIVDNSIAIDESGIYVVTSENMYKVVWTGDKLSYDEKDGGWKAPYDTMDGEKAVAMGALSRGSGTTPTLMGFGGDEDKLVLIADADENGTKLVAFWRDQIPSNFKQKEGTKSRRIADQIRVDVSDLTIEPSPVVMGNRVVVINCTFPEPSETRGDIFGNAMTSGVTRHAPRGIQQFVWNTEENKFEKSWTNMTIDNTDTMVPHVSAKSNVIYFANKVGLNYEYTGLDWNTGEMVGRWKMPTESAYYNNWGGIGYFLEDGDLILGGFFSAKRINFEK
ncbi:hypothetical protein [Flammeovirga aprica]|nr:hypothetical protein [Flammeovirga aprica]